MCWQASPRKLLAGTILSECPTCHRPWVDEAEAGRITAEVEEDQRTKDRSDTAKIQRVREEARREGMVAQESATAPRIEALIAERDALRETMEAAVDARVEQRVAAKDVTHERQLADLRHQLAIERLEFAGREKRWQEDAEKLKRRSEDKSPNTLGDPTQHNLRRSLAEALPDDEVTETKHGQAGITFNEGDVKTKLVLENKNNQVWQEAFVPKLKADMRRHGSEHGILVVNTMPAAHRADDYFDRDGIIVVQAKSAVAFVRMIRPFLIAQAKRKLTGRNTDPKGTALLNYVNSEPVKSLFATKVFDKLRGEDAQEQADLTNRNKRRTHPLRRTGNAHEARAG
jgi:hypothetical protein